MNFTPSFFRFLSTVKFVRKRLARQHFLLGCDCRLAGSWLFGLLGFFLGAGGGLRDFWCFFCRARTFLFLRLLGFCFFRCFSLANRLELDCDLLKLGDVVPVGGSDLLQMFL